MPAIVVIGGIATIGFMAYKWYEANKKKGV
jgi:hypothetical protein